MALNPLVDSRDVRFVLFEMLGVDKLNRFELFSAFDKDVFEETLGLAEKISVNDIYPGNSEADREGAHYNPETHDVHVPDVMHGAYKAVAEAGFLSLHLDAEQGGMGLPMAISFPVQEYFNAANTSFGMYCASLMGTANVLIKYATPEMNEKYLGKMLTGECGGTMCLTEPEAGSDVGALKSKAIRRDDGTFLISGQKIFISQGEQDMVENIVHPVLARIEGDPEGTKGLSLFLVPKYFVNDDGSRGERNDMVCSGIEHKMGIRASATASLNFGDNGNCIGYLLGKEREGMKVMFQLMNEARTFTSLQALAVSSASYMHAVTYARGRVQGEIAPGKKVPIIEHIDVRRMLLYMKSMVEGMRMLTYCLCYNQDVMEASNDEAEKEEATAFVELLTPIAKAGNSDAGWLVTAEAIQVYGGYGYCQEYPVEQYARDVKVFSVYEGTNAIQSLDLTMRKILMNKDYRNFNAFKNRVTATVAKAKGLVDDKYIALVERGMSKVEEMIEVMKKQLAEKQIASIMSGATIFQQSMHMMVLAWLHLDSLTLTVPKKKELVGDVKGEEKKKLLDENSEAAYYYGRVLSSQFYISSEFPKFFGKAECVLNNDPAAIISSSEIFSGALAAE